MNLLSICPQKSMWHSMFGKIRLKAQRNAPMPAGWMIDRQGQPLTDPKRASEGFLVPIGGPKGDGLALMIGLLARAFDGAAVGRGVVDFTQEFQTAINTRHVIVAVGIATLCGLQDFPPGVHD